ncbi:hypothetical protein V8D89_003872 [Ganoderma adspersum]
MATCYFLYHEGAKIILRDAPVSFDEGTSEDALLRFIQAEDLSRCSHVRRLHVLMPTVPDTLANALVHLVPRMTSLEILFVAIEDALESHPDLLPTFSSLQSVKTILVAKAGERSCELLRALQSQLVEASIYFDSSRAALTSKTAYHPLVMLQRSTPTLTTLVCGSLVDSNIQLVLVHPPDVTYPHLHTLILHECAPLSLFAYTKCFPNLTHVCVKYHGPSPWEDGEPAGLTNLAISQRQREMNLALPGQLANAARGSAPPSRKPLPEYTGPLMDLWILGLTCPITRLTVEDAPASGARAPRALSDVLAYARPTELAVIFRGCALADVLATDFLASLTMDGAAGLRSLMVAVWVREGDRDLDVGRALDEIVEAVSHLNLTRLDVGINDGGIGGEEASDGLGPLLSGIAAAAGGAAAPQLNAHTGTGTSGTTPPSPDGAPLSPPASNADSDSYSDHSDSDADADADSNSDSAPNADPNPELLSLGERTLDAIDVPALTARLADAMPTLEEALIMVQRPHRCGSRLRFRTALFGRGIEGKSAHEWREVGGVLYQETEGSLG